MKKIGVPCDNYKIERFKREFDQMGIIYDLKPLTKAVSTFFIYVEEDQVQKVYEMCQQVQMDYKFGN